MLRMSDNANRQSVYLIVPEHVEKLWIMLMDLAENRAGQTSEPDKWVWVGALFPYAHHIEALAERGMPVAWERRVIMRPWTDANIGNSLALMVNRYSLAEVRRVSVGNGTNVEVRPRPLSEHTLYTLGANATQLFLGDNERAKIAAPKTASPIITNLHAARGGHTETP